MNMKYPTFKDFLTSRWRTLIFVSFLIVVFVNMMNNGSAYFVISSFTKRMNSIRLRMSKEITHNSRAVIIKEDVQYAGSTKRSKPMVPTNFEFAKGTSVTLPTFLLNATQPITLESTSGTIIPGLNSMDKYLQLPPMPPVTDTDQVISQRRDFKLILSANETCTQTYTKQSTSSSDITFDFDHNIFLLMTVKSVCNARDGRRAVRSSWGNETWIYENLGVRAKLIFLLGDCKSDEDQQKLTTESHEHTDILQWDLVDSFQQLPLKECLFLQWYTEHCQNVPFLYQGDDDMLVNVENILNYVFSLPGNADRALWAGSLLIGSRRITNPKSKYFVSKSLYPGRIYPPYVSGGGFLLNGRAAVSFFMESFRTRLIPMDDAFLGIMAKSIGIHPTDVDGFRSWGMKNPSPQNLATVKTYHRASPKKLVSMWKGMIKAMHRN